MKYIVLLGDGMSDEPMQELGGKTPLQAARTPHMDAMARRGRIGLARTVPEGYPPAAMWLTFRCSVMIPAPATLGVRPWKLPAWE